MNPENITILYVDDEEINLFLFKKSFSKKYDVITANSGGLGLEALKEHADKIIVVISDMRMPVMTGVEFIRKAKALHDNIVYYILTGFEYNDEIDAAIKTTLIQKFFTKPFNYEEIDMAIMDAISGI